VRNLDLDAFAVAEPAQSKADTSPDDGDLDGPIVQFGNFDLTLGGEVDRVGADFDLCAGLRAGAQRRASGDRKVQHGVEPFLRGADADISGDEAQPADSAWWHFGCGHGDASLGLWNWRLRRRSPLRRERRDGKNRDENAD